MGMHRSNDNGECPYGFENGHNGDWTCMCERPTGAKHVMYPTNGGVQCDTDDGPCACGAWHYKNAQPLPNMDLVGIKAHLQFRLDSLWEEITTSIEEYNDIVRMLNDGQPRYKLGRE